MTLALQTALEAVDFQATPILFEALEKAIKRLRASREYSPTAESVKAVSDLLRTYTGLDVTVYFQEDSDPNAMVQVPDLNRNHPVLNATHRRFAGSHDILSALKKKDVKSLEGTVDVAKGKVTGVFQELECRIHLTTGLIEDSSFQHEEVAAILLHEVGHLMAYMELIGRSVTTNYALLSVAEELTNSRDPKVRVELIDATAKCFELNSDQLEGLEKSHQKETVYTVLLTNHIQQTRAQLGSNVYDQRGFEFLADQYAARQGAGKPLVTALAKMQRRHPSTYSVGLFLLLEAAKLTLVALSTLVVNPVVLIALVFAYDPTDKIYDDPEERIRRIKHELIAASKDRRLPRERKEAIAKDLEMIESTLKEFNDRRSFYAYLYTTLLPGVRDQHKRMKHQQELEALANNAVFAQSLNFSLLKG